MQEVIIVPTYQRSAFLYVCLEAIRKSSSLPIHIFPDRGSDETEVCKHFPGTHHHTTWSHTYHGNSCNMMEALKWAYQNGNDVVYVIEDDAIVDETFFEWAAKAIDTPRFDEFPFAACGWRYSPDAVVGDGPNIMLPWYLSVCSAIPRRSLVQIIQHARPEYYSNMRGYLDRAYPASPRRNSNHYEQDGLILRVADACAQRCVWPRRPRATHIGWHGYHMDGRPLEGSLEERVALVRLALKDPTMLTRLMSGGKVPEMAKCRDCGRAVLTTNTKAVVVCWQCFHNQYPELPLASSSHYYLPA